MKNTRTLLFALASTYTAAAVAEVPHTFSAGTPAKASEVNANFKSLDEAISAVESSRQSDKTSLNNKIDKANTDIGQLSTQATTMLGSINQANQSLTDVKAELTTVKQSSDTNKSAVQTLQVKQGQTETTLNALGQQQQAQAGSINTLNTTVGGLSTSTAEQQQAIDKNIQDIAQNKASIGANKAGLDANKSDISQLKTDVAGSSSGISANSASISTNTASIGANAAAITANTTAITANTSGVNANKAAIAANKTGIETNKTNIATLNTTLTQTNSTLSNQVSAISDNSARTTANQSAIGTNGTDIQNNQTAIQSLNTEVNALKPLAERTFPKNKPTYANKNHNFTDPIILGNATFRLVKLPFIEFSTGDRYTLTVPTVAITNGNGQLNLQANLNTAHVNSTIVTDMKISGFPAIQVSLIDSNSLSVITRKSDNSYGNRIRVVQSASASVTIIIKETALTLTFNASKPVIDNESLTAGDFDYTQNIDWNLMQYDNQLIGFVDDLIDYIVITKVSP